jgi:hypothetical protein
MNVDTPEDLIRKIAEFFGTAETCRMLKVET